MDVQPDMAEAEEGKESDAHAEEKTEESDNDDSHALKKVKMEVFTDEESEGNHSNWSLSQILGGDIINIQWFRHHAGLILMILVFTILYISNRYASEQEMIKIDALKKELADKRYDALSRCSQLLQKCRQSSIIDYLKTTSDSAMEMSTVPPYVIK